MKNYNEAQIYSYKVIDEDELEEHIEKSLENDIELECPICLIPHQVGTDV